MLNVYEILSVPVAKPVTTPPVPTVASVLLLLLHVPPVVVLPNVVVNPAQTVGVPVIPEGNVFIVTGSVVKHPVGNE